jgi:deoxyribose-phosphate aldolase
VASCFKRAFTIWGDEDFTAILQEKAQCEPLGTLPPDEPEIREIVSHQEESQTMDNRAMAPCIDHTLLKAEATAGQVQSLCREAIDSKFASVCINPSYVSLAAKLLAGSGVRVCTVIGFPLGATTTAVKVAETNEAIVNGAEEVDMVINVGALKSGEIDLVKSDIAKVVSAAAGKAAVKVIIETCFLSDTEKVMACKLSKEAGADFVKTSTGFGSGGATVEDIRLMRETVGPEMGIKASGGIRDVETAKAMIGAGATRLGTSNSIAIIRGTKGK